MVLATRRRAATPAILIPDEQSWTVWNADPAEAALRPVLDLGSAAVVVVPERLPDALAEPLQAVLSAVVPGTRTQVRATPALDGAATEPWLRGQQPPEPANTADGTADDGSQGPGGGASGQGARWDDDHACDGERHSGHAGDGANKHEADHEGDGGSDDPGGHRGADDAGGHGGHEGHGDMMTITGDPSADGLVMEPIELALGPLGSPLPGGLVAEVTLDGDVVARCLLRATLRQPRTAAAPPAPDALSPVTWAAAIAFAAETDIGITARANAWLRIAGVELERAVSHLAWLRALARLLGWPALVDAACAALQPLNAARRCLPVELAAPGLPSADDVTAPQGTALDQTERVRELCESRRLAARTAQLGVVSNETAKVLGVCGPVARASGVAQDARMQDPMYRELGFMPVVRREGDALARTLLRVDELAASIALARGALERARQDGDDAPLASPAGVTLEGPRGPVRAQRTRTEWRLSAPGQQAALTAAGQAAVGLEWAAGLVTLVSFDLSSWRVGP